MLRKLFTPRASARRSAASVPPGTRIYAVGDIHGSDALLERLIAAVDADDAMRDPAETMLIFLGDLVDRGPRSAEVVERLRRLADARPGVRLLMGNHEEVFLQAVKGNEKALRMFSRIGGRETALSYGIDPSHYERMDYAELAHALAGVVPQSHIDFMSAFEDMIVLGDYAFVHAGVRPDVPLDQQKRQDLRWIRDPFLDSERRLDKMVVHGHTIADRVEWKRHRIGIDTGAYASGRLTALALEGEKAWTIEVD